MPTSLDSSYPYDNAPVTEAEWREMMRHMLGSASGVIRGFDNDFATTGDGSGMNVKVATGQCWIRGQFGKNTSIKTIPISAAHATLARKDRVVLRNDFVDNVIEIDVLTGTPAGSPATPSVTQSATLWETSLAIVDIPAADTSIGAAQVTDDRVYTSAHARFKQASVQSIPNNVTTKINWDTVVYRSGDVTFDDTNNDFILLRSGLWTITVNFRFVGNGTGIRFMTVAKTGQQDTDRLSQLLVPANGDSSGIGLSATVNNRFVVNDSVSAYAFQTSGGGLNSHTGEGGSNITFAWVSP